MAPPPYHKPSYSINALKRWSSKSKEISGVAEIKALHIYDFDNTLFSSPLPNPQVWQGQTIGQLQAYEAFAHGGWWHDPKVLEATGEGIEKEEPRGWEGYWNEAIVDLVRLSMAQKDVLNVMLTGRSETYFADIVQRIVNSRELDFDLVVLKPEVSPSGERFGHTKDFKNAFLRELVMTYRHADEIKIYEDRQNHVKSFRQYFENLNKSLLSHKMDEPPPPRKPITADVIHVCELRASLKPEVEIEVVQRMIERHNHAIMTNGPNPHGARHLCFSIRETFVYCGYLINQNDSTRLISLTSCPAHLVDSGEIKLLGSSILISPHQPNASLLKKVGGKGKKVTWQVTGLAKLEDRIWAARVAPVPDTESIHTIDSTPLVVLALRKGTRPIDANRIQHWNNVAAEKQLIFEAVVGDKVMMSIEIARNRGNDNRWHNSRPVRNERQNGAQKRKFVGSTDEEFLGKENFPTLGETSNAMANGERDDGSWVPGPRGHISQQNKLQAGDRHGQGKYFSQMKQQPQQQGQNRNFSGSGVHGSGRRNNPQQSGGQQKGNQGQRQSGNGNRGKGGNRAPAGYKSLDDYGTGGFDGTGDTKMGIDMVMNY